MDTITTEHYKQMAAAIIANECDETRLQIDLRLRRFDTRVYIYNGNVHPKQRPKFTKTGRAYTAKETRAFEEEVREWADDYKMMPVTYPVSVSILIHDEGTAEEISHSELGLVYPTRGDVDNLGKGILDALNKKLYMDDKQVSHLSMKRKWSTVAGFIMTVRRDGLSKSEYSNLLKFIKKAR